ncbi:MAG: hypothetical protein ABIF19_19185 [Planctomycetota bacterium]
MRRGFTLIEILVIVIITPFVFLIFDGLFRTLVSDIPWSWRIAQENTTMLNMLDQLQQDIDKATALPESFAGHTADDNLLLIESADGVLCYQLKDGQVLRRRLTNSGGSDTEEERAWSLPHAKIVWHVWARDGRRYAVESRAHIERSARGQWKKKMAHSRLYFAGAF